MLRVKRAGLKFVRMTNGMLKKMRPMGHKNTCRCACGGEKNK